MLLLGLPSLRPLSQEPHLRAVGKASVRQLECFPDGIVWPDSYVLTADGRRGQSNFRTSWLCSPMADRPWATPDPRLPSAPAPLEAWPGCLLGSRTRRSFQETPSLEVCSLFLATVKSPPRTQREQMSSDVSGRWPSRRSREGRERRTERCAVTAPPGSASVPVPSGSRRAEGSTSQTCSLALFSLPWAARREEW